jgi:TPR repeat protein
MVADGRAGGLFAIAQIPWAPVGILSPSRREALMTQSITKNKLLSAWVASFALLVAVPACAQNTIRVSTAAPSAAQRYTAGVAMEQRKDEKGAFLAYMEAAEAGHPPAQRRLGEIYDTGNSAVERNFSESIRWYQKAREGGEIIPTPIPRMPTF